MRAFVCNRKRYVHYKAKPLKVILGPIRTSRQNRNCPWQNPRTNFVVTIFSLVCCIRIDMVKVFKLCRRMATDVSEKLLYSQSVSLQHVDSKTGHREGRSYSAAQNSVVYIKDSLQFGLNSIQHYDSICPLRK